VSTGSTAYYKGFLESPVSEDALADRGDGLEQAAKLGGGAAALLALGVLGFMASNGLL